MANHPKRGGRSKPCVNPTVAEIRRAQAKAKAVRWEPDGQSYTVHDGLTNWECAALVCVSERTWENWVADEGTLEHRPMPAGAWKLFRYEVGLLRYGEWIDPRKEKKVTK